MLGDYFLKQGGCAIQIKIANSKYIFHFELCKLGIMITLLDCAKYFKFVSFLLYQIEG